MSKQDLDAIHERIDRVEYSVKKLRYNLLSLTWALGVVAVAIILLG